MGLYETWIDARNRLIARPAFREWAQKIPIFRYFTNRNAEKLFSLCSGFIHSQVLAACIDLQLFRRLADGGMSLDLLAEDCGLPPERLARLLDAAAALALLERLDGDRYALGDVGAALCGNDGVEALVRHHDALYEDLAEPLAPVRDRGFEGRLRRFWAYAATAGDATAETDVGGYSDVMAASQTLVAGQALEAIDFGSARRVLDVGGGAGAFAIALARRWPDLGITVVDLPAVTALAERRIADAGLEDRIEVEPLDMFAGPLPRGHDLITFVRVLHDHEDAAVERLLAAAAAALEPGQRVAIIEPMADDSRAGRLIEAYFSIYLLAMGQGRPRRFETLARFLTAAGFEPPTRRRTRMPLITSVVLARRAGLT